MNIYMNKSCRVTAVKGSVVYEFNTDYHTSLEIVETWLRGVGEHATREQKLAARSIETLIVASPRIANRQELEARDSDVLRLFNENVNPSGRAGSSQWAICR